MPSAMSQATGGAPSPVTPDQISSIFGGFLRNKVVNGSFDIWQRATSFSTPASGSYTADRWRESYDGTIGAFTVGRQAFTVGQTDVPNEPEYFLRWDHTSAGSGSTFRRLQHRVENVRTLAGRVAVLTLWAKADASRTVTPTFVQNFGSGGSADVQTTPTPSTMALTTSWQKFTITATIPSISGKTVGSGSFLEVRLDLPINAAMTLDFAQVQLEENGATDFEEMPISIQYSRANRFYQVVPCAVGTGLTTVPFKVPMRTAPTISGGGTGFATGILTADGATASQNALASQTLTLDAEL